MHKFGYHKKFVQTAQNESFEASLVVWIGCILYQHNHVRIVSVSFAHVNLYMAILYTNVNLYMSILYTNVNLYTMKNWCEGQKLSNDFKHYMYKKQDYY